MALITTEDVGDVCVVRFNDRHLNADYDFNGVAQELAKLVEGGKRKLLLDYASVDRKSTSMLGVEATLHTRVERAGGKLVLCGITDNYMKVYRITRLDSILNFAPDVPTGLTSF